MRVNKIICDGCGKEITGYPIVVYADMLKRDGDFIENGPIYAPKKDFCSECLNRIKGFIETMGTTPLPKVEEPKVEEPKPAEEPKQPAKSKASKPTSIKELVLQGKSKEEVCRITGCSKLTYDQTKYQLKKKGLLPQTEEATVTTEPVKCSKVHGTCAFADKKELQCNYIGITGKMRGCDAEACDKYVKKGGKK